jgi:hypothetical protein
MSLDESTADDGAIFAFWAFVEAVVAGGHPVTFDPDRLDRLRDFRAAVAAFEAAQ